MLLAYSERLTVLVHKYGLPLAICIRWGLSPLITREQFPCCSPFPLGLALPESKPGKVRADARDKNAI